MFPPVPLLPSPMFLKRNSRPIADRAARFSAISTSRHSLARLRETQLRTRAHERARDVEKSGEGRPGEGGDGGWGGGNSPRSPSPQMANYCRQ
jgi:hypothetical protein